MAEDDPVASFFDQLTRRELQPLLRKVSGRVRFELVDGADTESWIVTIDDGDLRVERGAGEADCTISGDRSLFAQVISGHANAFAAVLRGALRCRGDIDLLFPIQRIFPDPPRGWDPTAGTRSA